jgi:hypothetical protein
VVNPKPYRATYFERNNRFKSCTASFHQTQQVITVPDNQSEALAPFVCSEMSRCVQLWHLDGLCYITTLLCPQTPSLCMAIVQTACTTALDRLRHPAGQRRLWNLEPQLKRPKKMSVFDRQISKHRGGCTSGKAHTWRQLCDLGNLYAGINCACLSTFLT